MARLSAHGKVLRQWKTTNGHTRYFLTDKHWILKTYGPRGGRCHTACRPSQQVERAELLRKLEELSKPEQGIYIEEKPWS